MYELSCVNCSSTPLYLVTHDLLLIDSHLNLEDVSKELRRGVFYDNRREDWCFPTIDVCNFSGRDWKVQLSNTPGIEAFQCIREMIYPGTDVFVVCYDMCSDNSLCNIRHFFQNEFKAVKDLAPVILCGCKYDNWLELTKHTDCIRRDGPIDLREVAQVTLLRCDAFFMTFLFQLNRSQRKSTLFSTFSHRLKLAMVYLEKPMR